MCYFRLYCKNFYSFQTLGNLSKSYALCYFSFSPSPSLSYLVSLPLSLFLFSLSSSDSGSLTLLIFQILVSHSSNSVEVGNVYDIFNFHFFLRLLEFSQHIDLMLYLGSWKMLIGSCGFS